MEHKILGATDIVVSVLGFGTVKLGRNQQVKYPSGFTIPDDHHTSNLLALTRDLGINLIDTAPAYGTSEERLGQLLPDRNDWVIVTKVGESFENGQSQFDFSAKTTRLSVQRSLTRLRREYVDVVLVHSDGNDMHIIQQEEVLSELDKLKQQGLIRAFGMSTKTVQGGLWISEYCDLVMATRNLNDDSDLPVIDAAYNNNKGVLIKKGLQSGHADQSAGGAGVEKAIEHVFSHPGVSSMIVGTINENHLRHNVELCDRVFAKLKAIGS